jgi:class 3 adenylate cyclase
MDYPYLKFQDANQIVQQLTVFDKIFIGRTCQGIEPQKRIILKNPLVSRDHAVVSRTTHHLLITDTSINGTWINDIRMTAGSSKELKNGDIIRIAESIIQVVDPKPAAPVGSDTLIADKTVVYSTELLVTNLVADIRGFTGFSQDQASSKVCDFIREIFDRFSTIVVELNGTIKDYAGDAIFAFWDHQKEESRYLAVLACQTALKQMQSLAQIREELSGKYCDAETIQMGWGVTTGKVTISHFGSRAADLALVGDCTNLAFRLSGMANKDLPHKIIVCSQTAALVAEKFTVKDLGDVIIRGRKGKERIFALS